MPLYTLRSYIMLIYAEVTLLQHISFRVTFLQWHRKFLQWHRIFLQWHRKNIFFFREGNVLVAANSQLSEAIKEIAGECGDEDTYVIDRFNADSNDQGRSTLIVADTEHLMKNKLVVGEKAKTGAPFLYRGIGMTIDPENPLLVM